MSPKEKDPEKPERLLAGLLEGSLGAGEDHELLEAMQADEAFAREVSSLVVESSLLQHILLGQPAAHFVEEVVRGTEYLGDEDRFAARIVAKVPERAGMRRMPRWLLPVAAAFLIGLVAGVVVFRPWAASGAGASVPRLENVRGEVLLLTESGGGAVRTGREVSAGSAIKTVGRDSSAVLRYPDSTRVELGGDTILRQLAAVKHTEKGSAGPGKLLYLERGALSGTISPQPAGRPMVLATPQGQAEVLGTSLRLTVGAGSTRLEVVEGRVALRGSSDQDVLQVSSGYGATLAARTPLVAEPLRTVDITLDASRRFQTIAGFGTFVNDWNPAIADVYRTERFQQMAAQDLGCSILRSSTDPDLFRDEDLDLEHLNADKINMNAFSPKVVATLARGMERLKRDDLKLIISIFTPPAWMKTNNSAKYGGHLRPDRVLHFGKSCAAFCKAFEDAYGIPVFALSIRNEPSSAPPFGSCQYTPEEYRDAIKAVGAAFRKWGIRTKLMGPEIVGTRGAHYVDEVLSYVRAIEQDPEASRSMDLWDVHDFLGDGGPEQDTRSNWSALREALGPSRKDLWQMSSEGHDQRWSGANGSLSLGLSLHDALVYGNVSAYLYGQVIDPGYSLLALTKDTDATAKKYCVAKHYFRVIRPGYVRIGATPDSTALSVSAFLDPRSNRLTCILLNAVDSSILARLTLPTEAAGTRWSAYRTSAAESFQKVPLEAPVGRRLSVQVPAFSLVTLETESP